MIPKFNPEDHSEECNKIFFDMKQCLSSFKRKIFGDCDALQKQLWNCMNAEFRQKYKTNKSEWEAQRNSWNESKNLADQLNMYFEHPEKYKQFVEQRQKQQQQQQQQQQQKNE